MKSKFILLLITVTLCSCATQAGQPEQPGEPIATKYQKQLDEIVIGKTNLADLKRIFDPNQVSLKEEGDGYQVWEVVKQGDLDESNFLMWGVTAHYKDQALYFRFEHGVLVSYTSEVLN